MSRTNAARFKPLLAAAASLEFSTAALHIAHCAKVEFAATKTKANASATSNVFPNLDFNCITTNLRAVRPAVLVQLAAGCGGGSCPGKGPRTNRAKRRSSGLW